MLYANNLQKRTLSGGQVVEDNQNSREDSPLYNTIAFGIAGVVGYKLYKSGAFKEISHELLKYADDIAKGGDKAALTMHSIKQWAQLGDMSKEALARAGLQRYTTPANSIFRDRESTIFYDLFKDLQNFNIDAGFTSASNFRNLRKIMADTQADMHLLRTMTEKNLADLPKLQNDYIDTQLYNHIQEITNLKRNFNHMSTNISSQSTSAHIKAAMDDFLKRDTLTSEMAAQQFKESGYRMLTLGDVAELQDGRLVRKSSSKININSTRNPDYEAMLDKINRLSVSGDNLVSSSGTILQNDNWKNLIIDSSMRIDKMGDIIDFRMTQNNANAFIKSLATDFRLPVVQFNPLKTLGFDKLTRIKPRYGYIAPGQWAPAITGVAGQDTANTVGEWLGRQYGEEFKNSAVSIIDGKAFISKPDVDATNPDKLIQIGSGLKLYNISYADETMGLSRMHNSYRQIAGISASPGKLQSDMRFANTPTGNKIAQMFDLGFQEWTPERAGGVQDFDSQVGIDELQNNFIERLRKLYVNDPTQTIYNGVEINYKNMFGQGFEPFQYNGKNITPHMYDVTREGYKITDIYQDLKSNNKKQAMEDFKGFVGQYFSGQTFDGSGELGKYFTEETGRSWNIFNQISEGLKTAGLGLSVESKSSVGAIAGNLLIKRALPLYMLTKVPEMINYLSEPFFGQDEDGNRGNITKALMNGVVKPIDVGAHGVMDLTGVTNLVKFMEEFTPGSDQILELPGIHALGLNQNTEERRDYIENGYDPIRKGRWWGAGNTPLTGSKIEYWRPNLYRRIEADVDFSDSKYGSRQEYFNNTWYPNIANPLAPLNHFIFDRNHYDKKHYYDRPYLQTSPEGAQMPLIGPAFSQTIGRVINPPQKMHKEYWNYGFPLNPNDELPSTLLTEGKLYADKYAMNTDIHMYQQLNQNMAMRNAIYQQQLSSSSYQAKQVVSRSYIQNAGITFQQTDILPLRSYDRYDNNFEVYSTPSGALSIVDVPDTLNLYNVNQDLKRWSINRINGTNRRVTINDINGPGIAVGNESPVIDNAFVYGMGEQFNVLGEVAGLRGFMVQQFITGHANQNATIVEDSGYAYSFNNDFWEENFGGLGGNMSEIVRRFVPKRNNNTTYINPIRNTMPSWMPGSNYFTDFKHGDPYSKIMNGEERLPGEGYERLHHIKGLTNFNIGSSSIGYDQAYIVRHMLKQDNPDTGFEEDTLALGTKIHNQIEKAWMDSGFAFSTEGEVKDERNGIIGYYDAMVHDPTSRTGVGIVDIKTTSAKKLEEIRKTGKALEHHQRQVNYYLWATENEQSRGYIYYVDKENLNNSFTVGFDYDRGMLKDTLNNVYTARKTIINAVDKGVIGRGELYSPLDQFRILADVAPYSQEYKDAATRVAAEKLSPEEQREVQQIRDRVQQQKEPLRVYDYKFQTSNLKTETVTVQKVIDNNTIVTREYGKKHAIKFAGIHVSESNSDMYDDRTMNDAAADVIRKHVRAGQRITISYDADERNKYSKDSTRSIRAVVSSNGQNVNRLLLNKGLATENEDDNSPAAIHARYSRGEIAFGSAMETITHKMISNIPIIGTKFLQVRSPYEAYREREVYGKDFQTWNKPISSILIPRMEARMANENQHVIGKTLAGVFIGSLFGAKGNRFGKIVGATVGGLVVGGGSLLMQGGHALMSINSDSKRDWRPLRRQEQEEMNEYVDTLKYVKNMRLYEQYKTKARVEDHFDVDKFSQSKDAQGVRNKIKQNELQNYKRKVKLDFKHRDNYNFKYGSPKYVTHDMTKKETISAINKELSELQSQRKVTKVPLNAIKAIEFKQAADQTMYGYNPGDSLVNLMSALPKKDRQYFKHFMDAPEEEKEKILRIAPSYMRRALQSTWGKTVDNKPTLNEYFSNHGLPDENWIGWDENVSMDDIKVKLVNKNGLDPGEFDIWADNQKAADAVNIPIPQIHASNSPNHTRQKLLQLLGANGYHDVQAMYMNGHFTNKNSITIIQDAQSDVEAQIQSLDIF